MSGSRNEPPDSHYGASILLSGVDMLNLAETVLRIAIKLVLVFFAAFVVFIGVIARGR
jgi:hypothetical protein